MEPTKGVWKAVGRGVFAGDVFICHADFGTQETNGREYNEAIANAHLIAAAPDLLSIVEGIIERGLLNKKELILNAANAAIAKAKGGE